MTNPDDPSPDSLQPLDYAVPGKDDPQPLPSLGAFSVLCFFIGIPIAGMGVAVTITDLLQGWLEKAAVPSLIIGGAICWAGMWFKKNRRPPSRGYIAEKPE